MGSDLKSLRELYDGPGWEKTLDPEIKDLILYLNKLPGVATIFSCAGGGKTAKGEEHKEGTAPYLTYYVEDPHIAAILYSAGRYFAVELVEHDLIILRRPSARAPRRISGRGADAPLLCTSLYFPSFHAFKEWGEVVQRMYNGMRNVSNFRIREKSRFESSNATQSHKSNK